MSIEQLINQTNQELNSKWINSINPDRKIVTPNKSLSYQPYGIYTFKNARIKSRLFFESLESAVKSLENN